MILNPRCARPSKAERMSNRRSRSARLRAIRKNVEISEDMKPQIFDGLDFEKDWEEEEGD